jgi:hypothetical protein
MSRDCFRKAAHNPVEEIVAVCRAVQTPVILAPGPAVKTPGPARKF